VSERSERLRAMIYARAHTSTRRVRPTLTDYDCGARVRVRGVYNIVAVCAAATCVGVGGGSVDGGAR